MAKVAAIQMASGPNVSANLSEVSRLISDAVANGAELVVLPENFAHMGMSEMDILNIAELPLEKAAKEQAPIQSFLASQAKSENIWIVGGTIPVKQNEKDQKVRAACLLFNNQGEVVARYDKIHLFDVDLGEKCGSYNESAFTEAGEQVVVTDTPFGRLGLAVCYDLRFPELFRYMVSLGVDILAVASSFTATTGKAHWEILNRARAIENLCYVISSAQGGYHVNGRETYGHSMIIDPWGGIIDSLPRGSGFAISDIDSGQLKKVRKNFPVLEHVRLPCTLK
jgi:nitrilase